MSFFVFRTASSTGARELADTLGGRRLRKFEGGRFFGGRMSNHPINVRAGDVVVCWGAHVPAVTGIRFLNNVALHNKFQDAQTLTAAGVKTIEVSRTRPADVVQAAAVDPAIQIHGDLVDLLEDLVEAPFARNEIYVRGVGDAVTRLQRLQNALAQPVPVGRRVPAGDWVGRVNNHMGGTDLLTPPPTPDFYVKKLALVKEYRIHSFDGLSIRAGSKQPREGFANPHAWVRSYDGGWRIVYDGFKSKEKMRDLAASAVKALGLDFGAVDIGELADKSLVVLEVNRAPGISDGSAKAYANAIERWSGVQQSQQAQQRPMQRAA